MNWGTKITISMVCFALILLAMVITCMRQDIFLVADDYYAQELRYQNRIEEIKNFNSLQQPLRIQYDRKLQQVKIEIPSATSETQGAITFFRPSDSRFDFQMPIALDATGSQQVDLSNKIHGLWKVKIAWTHQGKAYYNEQNIVI